MSQYWWWWWCVQTQRSESNQHSSAVQPSTVNAMADVTSSHHLNQNQHNASNVQPSYTDHSQTQPGYSSFSHQMSEYSGPDQTHVQEHGLNNDTAGPAAIRSAFAPGVGIYLYAGHSSLCLPLLLLLCIVWWRWIRDKKVNLSQNSTVRHLQKINHQQFMKRDKMTTWNEDEAKYKTKNKFKVF